MRIALVTATKPHLTGGGGCSVLTYNFVRALSDNVKIIVGPPNPSGETKALGKTYFPLPRLRVPKLNYFFPKLKGYGEALLFKLKIKRLNALLTKEGIDRIFFFPGCDWRFLLIALAISKDTKIPCDFYLVDDFEESNLRLYNASVAKLAVRLEEQVLKRMDRVWTISEGYADHIQAKYKINCKWLPIPIIKPQFNDSGRETPGKCREIVYLGNYSYLYKDALLRLMKYLEERRLKRGRCDWRLLLISLAPPEPEFARYQAVWTTERGDDRGKIQELLKRASLYMIPYSFLPENRLLVSTSFPTKLTEAVQYGLSLLIWGPEYSSINQYGRKNNMNALANSETDLDIILDNFDSKLTEDERTKMNLAYEEFHSPNAFRKAMSNH